MRKYTGVSRSQTRFLTSLSCSLCFFFLDNFSKCSCNRRRHWAREGFFRSPTSCMRLASKRETKKKPALIIESNSWNHLSEKVPTKCTFSVRKNSLRVCMLGGTFRDSKVFSEAHSNTSRVSCVCERPCLLVHERSSPHHVVYTRLPAACTTCTLHHHVRSILRMCSIFDIAT